MINYDKIYSSFETPGAFNLLDADHPLEFYIGIDDRGRKCIILRSKFRPDSVKSTSAIDVSIGQVKNNIWSLGFHLIQNSMSGLFYRFIDDIVESSKNLPNSVNDISSVIKRYNSWKKMFYNLKKEILGENEIIGLIGELLFLKNDMLKKYDEQTAVNSWSGCDKTHKDFSVEKDWENCNSVSVNELIPEFYEENIEFLCNFKNIKFGLNSRNESIDNVILPKWAKTPKDFLQKMRNALESEYVSNNLNLWIDLIFVYKQRGEEAIKSFNGKFDYII